MPEIQTKCASLEHQGKPYRICYDQVGEKGPIILYIHGWSHSRRVWKEVIQTIAGDYIHIALDMPGFGKSTFPTRFDHSIESYGECLAEFIEKLPAGPFAIIAHSMGGLVTLAYLSQTKTSVTKIAICGSPLEGVPFLEKILSLPVLAEVLMSLRCIAPNFILRYGGRLTVALENAHKLPPFFFDDIRLPHYKTMCACLRKVVKYKLPELALSGKEILIVRGEKEIILDHKIAEKYANLWHAKLVEIPGISHTHALEDANAFSQILRQFLENSSAGISIA